MIVYNVKNSINNLDANILFDNPNWMHFNIKRS